MNAVSAPKVSIIIPAYNAARYIRTSLRSVLEQTNKDFEVIVVDDGSTDDTKAAVLALPGAIHYIYQSNQGVSAARNTGIVAAKGELICFLDADDSWTPDKLRAQVEFLDKNPKIGLVFSDEEEFDEEGVHCSSLLAMSRFYSEIVSGSIIDRAFQKLLLENFIPTSTVMVRRHCFDITGLFDVDLKAAEDRDMWSRIAAAFPIVCLPKVLGRKRVVLSSLSHDVENTLRSRIRVWSKARRLFPDLAPIRTVNALLAPTYVQLGFVLLHKDNTREARKAGLMSFRLSRDPAELFLATSLVIFSLTGRAFADSVFRIKRRLLSKGNVSTSS
jgi:glycosyltransferase involved in cell wall biosynthesis